MRECDRCGARENVHETLVLVTRGLAKVVVVKDTPDLCDSCLSSLKVEMPRLYDPANQPGEKQEATP